MDFKAEQLNLERVRSDLAGLDAVIDVEREMFRLRRDLGLGIFPPISVGPDPGLGMITDAGPDQIPDFVDMGGIFVPFGIPDGDRPEPLRVRGLPGDGITGQLAGLAANAAVIRQAVAPGRLGTGFFVAPDAILTAAHVAEFFSEVVAGAVSIHYSPALGTPDWQAFPRSVHVLRDWDAGSGRTETDIAVIRLDTPRPGHEPVQCGVLDAHAARVPVVEHDALVVGGLVGGPLKLTSFWDQLARAGSLSRGQKLTSGVYVDPARTDVLPGHILGGHTARSYPGWSGAAVLQTRGGAPGGHVVVGVHAHGADDANYFAGFTPDMIDDLNGLADGGGLASTRWRRIEGGALA